MHFTLRQLQVFVAIAQHGTVLAAAEALSLSQSAASTALSELEKQFDLQLFDRLGRRLRINAEGRDLLPLAVELLDRARELDSRLRARSLMGDLRVGATLTIGNYLATLVVADFLQCHPASQLALKVSNTEQIVRQLVDFELDLGLIEGSCDHPELEVSHWVDDELVVFAAPQHPLAGLSVPWAQLADEAWIVRERGSGTRARFDQAVAGRARPHIRLELEHTEAIKRAVESGLGVGCISRLALKDAFRRGSLMPVSCPELDLMRAFSFVWHRRKYHTAAMKAFLEHCHALTGTARRSDEIALPSIP